MKKFFSTQCSDGAFNLGALVLRVTFGLLLLIDHGLGKITHFSEYEYTFYNFINIGHRWSLVLCIFAEVVCAGLLALGMFTRFAALVLVINFAVASFALLMTGPGKYSVDGAMGK